MFKLQLPVKPALSTEEKKQESLKSRLKKMLDDLHSRKESIETLVAEDKSLDAIILLNHLLQKISQTIYHLSGISLPEMNNGNYGMENFFDKVLEKTNVPEPGKSVLQDREWEGIQGNIKELTNILNSCYLAIEEETDISTMKLDEISVILLNYCGKLVKIVVKNIQYAKKSKLKTRLDDYQMQIRKLAAVGVIFVMLLLLLFKVYNIKYYTMQPGNLQVFYSSAQDAVEAEDRSVKKEIEIHYDWQTFRFELENNVEIARVRVDPGAMAGIRFNIRKLAFLGQDGTVIFSRNFNTNDNLLLDAPLNFIGMNHLKSGKMIPQNPVEMITTGNDPFFILLTGEWKDVKFIEVEMRFSEEYRKLNQ